MQVDEPTVEDTISILRGLKERYEVFHGVKISDNALIAAATLSDRYITDRFLPDKAIDLVDEACAMIKTEMEVCPARWTTSPTHHPAADRAGQPEKGDRRSESEPSARPRKRAGRAAG